MPPIERQSDFAAALRAGEIQSVLVIGDSISDGNGDGGTYIDQNERKELGGRLILDADGECYYEKIQDSQGWVKHFRRYLMENTPVTVFHNAAINGKSAKWFYAYKEQLFTDDHPRYDAIFVMLGTNDRWDCLNEQEFYTEYSQLLSYLKEKCGYLTVLTPIPAFDTYAPLTDTQMHMDTRQAADTVLRLCVNNGYECHDLYSGLISYARSERRPLDEYYFGGTHPNTSGYLALWRLIAEEVGLNLPISDIYTRDEVPSQVVQIKVNRPEITEQTNLFTEKDGVPIFPAGVSTYGTTEPFCGESDSGGTLVTRRYENDAGGYQIFKPFHASNAFIRYAPANGVFGPWFVTNREQFSAEGRS